jgi:hypothetical protein
MRRGHIVCLAMIAVLALAAAGCGGGKDKNGAEEGAVTCEGSALTGSTGLPASFPTWDEVTLTKKSQEGPTLVVEGWFDGDLKSAHDEYKDRFESAGYTVLFDELEDKDSEVSYKDAQGKTSGQVALKDECDNGHISVHITNRPA